MSIAELLNQLGDHHIDFENISDGTEESNHKEEEIPIHILYHCAGLVSFS